jgi:hypothetical protein
MNEEQVRELIIRAVVAALEGYDDGQLSHESHIRVAEDLADEVMYGGLAP